MLENGNVFVEEFEELSYGTVTRLYTVVNKAGEKVVLCDYGQAWNIKGCRAWL